MRGLAVVLLVGSLAGCATAPRLAPIDVAGRWVGAWSGAGVFVVPRDEEVTLDLVQDGALGTGRLVMHGTIAAESVPDAARDSGMTGIRVVADVSGSRVRLRHELGRELFDADMVVQGDRMVGRVLGTEPPILFDLTREKVRTASAPAAAEPPRVAPPPATVTEAPRVEPPPAEVPPPVSAVTPPPALAERSAPPPAEFGPIAEVRTIHFDFDSALIRAGDAAILDLNAEWLRANPDRLVLIGGHCDERGTVEYNLALGERRALAARAYLVGRGIAAARLTVTSYGIEDPVCTDSTESCWARNRRATFRVK